jgi:hypothetical protein
MRLREPRLAERLGSVMRTPETGLDEKTKQKLDRVADRGARITAFIAGIALLALGIFGCAFVLAPWSWPTVTVSGLWTGRLRGAIPFSVASIFIGLRILYGAIGRRRN